MLIYKITNTVNNKVYIGQTRKSLEIRASNHVLELNKNKHNNKHLQNSWNLYGSNNFKFEIIEHLNFANGWNLHELEIFYIKYYKSYDMEYGYNLTYGGEGAKHNKETKEKISKKLKANNYKMSEERKLLHSKIMKGKKHTKEAVEKLTKNHFSKRSDYINPMFGKKLSPETKLKIRKNRKHPKVIAKILETNIEICFYSIKDAKIYFNIHHTQIDKCLKGIKKQYKGVSFKYA